MSTSTVPCGVLNREKIWLDKPFYDRAERNYYEKRAKVVSRKVVGGCTLKSDNSVSGKCQDLINTNTLKSKAEKSKDNKLAHESNESNVKRSKCRARNLKVNKDTADVCNMQNKENTKTSEKFDSVRDNVKENENTSPSEKSKKYNAKEAKEKRNKEDTRNKNRESERNDVGGNKEIAVPFARNKEQLPDQATQPSPRSFLPTLPPVGSLADEVAKARQHIKQSLQCMDDIAHIANHDVTPRVVSLEKENQALRNILQDLKNTVEKLAARVKTVETLEQRVGSLEARIPYVAICPAKPEELKQNQSKEKKNEDDEDIDLFGSDSEGEDAEAAKVREERLAAYAAKKSKKPALIAKSNIILDVKPWSDETDMKEMEKEVRKIETDGLLWGASKLVPLAFGIHKLQISCVVEDDKVSIDWLTEQIQELEEYVQSVDIAAFNKV